MPEPIGFILIRIGLYRLRHQLRRVLAEKFEPATFRLAGYRVLVVRPVWNLRNETLQQICETDGDVEVIADARFLGAAHDPDGVADRHAHAADFLRIVP